MTPASKSVYYFGFYLLALGAILVISPNLILSIFGLPLTTELWIRILGLVIFNEGIMDIFLAKTNPTLFLWIYSWTRFFNGIVFATFVAFGWASWQLLMFGFVDFAAAAWTVAALRAEQK